MRVPVSLVGASNVPKIEEVLKEKLRIVGCGESSKIVFRRDQWDRFVKLTESSSPLSEASSVVLRAYSMLMKNYAEAKKTPEGRMAIISAVMSIYAADPTVGARLQFALNL